MTAVLPSGFGSAIFGAAEVAATSAVPHVLDVLSEALVYEITESAFVSPGWAGAGVSVTAKVWLPPLAGPMTLWGCRSRSGHPWPRRCDASRRVWP
jgi:hypothetical protein